MLFRSAVTPAAFAKMRRPYEDLMYTLGVKDADTYLLTEQEVMEMVKQSQAAMANKEPSPDDKKKLADAALAQARTQEVIANVQGTAADKQLEAISLIGEGKAVRY